MLFRAWKALLAACTELDQRAAQRRAMRSGCDRGPAVAFIVGALCLTFMEYSMGPRVLATLARAVIALFPGQLPEYEELRGSRWWPLSDLTFWVLTRAVGCLLFPALAVRFLLRLPLAAMGLALPGRLTDLGPYALLYLLVLPVLVLAATRPEFLAYYPFYRHAADSWIDLLIWEALYAFQFVCVEFFFRGFLIQASASSLGSHAVLAAMVPYCMVHFSKPLPEVLGAIPAGLILGMLALRAGSIWGGVALHVAVAWTMDLLAIAQTTGFPTTLWPQ